MMSRITFEKEDEFTLSWEKINEFLFVHVEINNFSKDILDKIRLAWIKFASQAWLEGYEEIFTYTKDPRIVRLVGGAEEVGLDNPDLPKIGMRMFKWDLR